MSDLPLISVIMPCYNAGQFITDSVTSVFKQTYQNLELIVVNDGSTDHSLEVLQTIDDPRLNVINQQNCGVCRARNKALESAKGSLIAFLDADDTWHTECLFKLYLSLTEQPSAALAYCGWQNIGLPGGRGEPFIPPDYESQDKAIRLLENCRWPIHAALTHRYAIEEAGCFDTRFITSEDFLLWLKIGTRHRIVRVPEVLAYYHHRGEIQATHNKEKNAINHWRAQMAFIKENKKFINSISRKKIRVLIYGELLRRGYESYWKRDLKTARTLFKIVMKNFYGTLHDWKYMIPSILPYQMHRTLVQKLEQQGEKS